MPLPRAGSSGQTIPGVQRITPTTRPTRRQWRGAVWRCRWLLVALALAVAARVLVPSIAGALQPTRPVVVTAREIQLGQVLDSAVLTVAPVDTGLIPAGALT
jgi:hypothetical protein